MKNVIKPIGMHGFACNCCGETQLPHMEVFVCPDCGAVICAKCVEDGEAERHICEEEAECE